jgi:hypothetical protein
MFSLIVYQSLTNPYVRFIRVNDGGIVAAATGVVSLTTAWATSALSLTKNDLIGGIPVTIPEDMPCGDYDMIFYDAAAPADSDAPVLGKRIAWTGRILMGLPLDV